jgi:hypothetical protein
MTNDLGHFLVVTACLFGGIATLLFLLAAIDPQTNRTGLAYPKGSRMVRGAADGRPVRLERPDARTPRDRRRTAPNPRSRPA